MPADDPYDLERFVRAQAGVHEVVLAELRRGHKASHWMWFVFPQLAGLGRSTMAQRYAISSLDEARAYLNHPVLGPRLAECAEVAAAAPGRTVEDVFGGIDALKLHSSMTLFRLAAPDVEAFERVLARWFDGTSDPATEQLLR